MRTLPLLVALSMVCGFARLAAASAPEDDDALGCPEAVSWIRAAKVEPLQTVSDGGATCVRGKFPHQGWIALVRVRDDADRVSFDRVLLLDAKGRVTGRVDGPRREQWMYGLDLVRAADLDHDGVDEVVALDRSRHKDEQTATERDAVIAIRAGKPTLFAGNPFAVKADPDEAWDARCPAQRTLARRLGIKPGRTIIDVHCVKGRFGKGRMAVSYIDAGDELERWDSVLVVLGDKGGPLARLSEEGVEPVDSMMVGWGFEVTAAADLDADGDDELLLLRDSSAPTTRASDLEVLALAGHRFKSVKTITLGRTEAQITGGSEHSVGDFAVDKTIECVATWQLDGARLVVERRARIGAHAPKHLALTSCREGRESIAF